MNEDQTRKALIDRQLRLAGWRVGDPTHAEEEMDIDLRAAGVSIAAENPDKPYMGHQFADYALKGSGRTIAVVEAKKTSVNAQVGQEQGLQYAQHIQAIQGGDIPFVLYANGTDIFYWESDFYPPARLTGFPTPDDLEWLAQRHKSRKPLSEELINKDISGRGYQIQAIRSILEGIEAKQQKFLLVMATGTGKTRTAVALIDVLLRARWAKRVLFLVDRIALRDQALEAFKDHIPDSPRWPEQNEYTFDRNRRIYVSTYQSMLPLIEKGDTPQTYISPTFFDVVIADESHRFIYNLYSQILDYFNVIRLGLTATPTDRIDHNTFQIFECENQVPTFAYQFEDAIAHDPPYLSDFEVLNVRSKFQIEGIHGHELPPEIQDQLEAEGKDLDDIDFEGSQLERKVTNTGTNALIIREFMEECIKDDAGVIPGKTIFFALSKAHARRLHTIFDQMYPEYEGKLARVLVSEDSRVHGKGGLLDQFKNQNYPRIAISVDMLDTGVDIPELVNLVFAKPVYSYVKFWQMIGRGTRVLPDKKKNWCVDKDKFLIIDCWGNFDRFEMDPPGREPGSSIPLPVRLFRARLTKLEVATGNVRTGVIEDLKKDVAALPKNNVIVSENQSHLAELDKAFWNNLSPEDISFLRSTIAPVMRAQSQFDDKAMRFEILLIDYATAALKGNETTIQALQETITEQVSELPLAVNVVAQERVLIDDLLTPAWWVNVDESKLQEVIERLSPLMKYRQRRKEAMVKLNIEDLLQTKEWIEFGPESERASTQEYRDRVEERVKELVDANDVLKRLQAGECPDDDEIRELADLLEAQDPYVTEDLLRRVYDHKTAKFIQFMRHILGLQELASWPETVTTGFEDFIAQHNTFTEAQIQFIQTLKTFVLQRGTVEKENLIQPPFSALNPKGIRGLFKPAEIDEILSFVGKLVA